jgi:hypothetical protein
VKRATPRTAAHHGARREREDRACERLGKDEDGEEEDRCDCGGDDDDDGDRCHSSRKK